MKKYLGSIPALALIAVVGIMILPGCGGSDDSTTKQVEATPTPKTSGSSISELTAKVDENACKDTTINSAVPVLNTEAQAGSSSTTGILVTCSGGNGIEYWPLEEDGQ